MRNNTQSGVALIALLAIFMLSATGILLYRLNNRTDFMLENQAQTAQALAKAKEALIGHAATYAETHPGQPQGYLPCPDNNGDGSAETSCSSTGNSVIGRFPWKTLGLPPLRDGSGECLWYAVSGSYKCNPKKILTSDSDGLFTVEDSAGNSIAGKGNTVEEKSYHRAIAIVFAPGRIIDGQVRSATPGEATECGSNVIKNPVDPINDVKNYLDNYKNESSGLEINNYTGDGTLSFVPSDSGNSGFFATTTPSTSPPTLPPTSTFISAPLTRKDGNITNVIFNDVLMLITPKDFEPVYRRMDYWVAEKVKGCLNQYADTNTLKKYPWASQLDSNYTDDINERFGRIPLTLSNSASLYNDLLNQWPPECFDETAGLDDEKWGWWNEWKKMVFFAVDDEYSPAVSLAPPTMTTLSGEAMKMIVLVAGRRLMEERDETKRVDYLEGDNHDGNEEFEFKDHATSTFNDVVLGTPLPP